MNSNGSSIDGVDGDDDEDEQSDVDPVGKTTRPLYDKAGKARPITGRRAPAGNQADSDDSTNIVSSNIKTIVVICSKYLD